MDCTLPCISSLRARPYYPRHCGEPKLRAEGVAAEGRGNPSLSPFVIARPKAAAIYPSLPQKRHCEAAAAAAAICPPP